ncbi:hypothetical protein FQN54_009120 [Arachnomyces sp. PD_36]|nr:hypothetical protein FQN54_009120 [Arachnomyces sp. PD_36]
MNATRENTVDSRALVSQEAISQPLVVAGESFGTPEALNNALRRWSQELPREVFNPVETNDIAILSDPFHRLGYDIPTKLAEVSNGRSLTLDNLFGWWRQPISRGLSLTHLATLETKIYLTNHVAALQISKVGNSIVVGDMAKEELRALKENRRPTETSLSEEAKMSVKPWNIATTLRGLGPRADAVHLRRPYSDLEVQAEIDILLGKDRGLAWDFILQWRTMATETLKLQFSIWIHLEQHLNRAYPLPLNAMGDKIVLEDSKEHEAKASGSGTPRRSRHIKRDSRELSPRRSPPKRQGSSGIGIWEWFGGG